MRWRIFEDLPPLISEFSLSGSIGSTVARFLSLFSDLRILSLDALNFYDPGALDVVTALASKSKLEELTIKTQDHSIPPLPAGRDELNWRFRRTLVSLTIDISENDRDVVLSFEMWLFVHLLADTLQVLDLSFNIVDAELEERANTDSTPLPSL